MGLVGVRRDRGGWGWRVPSRRVRRRRALALRRLGDHLTRLGTRTAPRPRLISTRGTRGRVREHLGLHNALGPWRESPLAPSSRGCGERVRRACIARHAAAARLNRERAKQAVRCSAAAAERRRRRTELGGSRAATATPGRWSYGRPRDTARLSINHPAKGPAPPGSILFLGARWCSLAATKKNGGGIEKQEKEGDQKRDQPPFGSARNDLT